MNRRPIGDHGRGGIPAEEVQAFMNEMRPAVRGYQVVQCSGPVHSFTDGPAGTYNSRGAAYDQAADRRSWRSTQDFVDVSLRL